MKLRLIRILLVLLVATALHYGMARNQTAATPPAAPTSASCAMPATASKVAAKPYPFSTSIVSGVKLGGKDTTIKLVQDGYDVKFASQDEADTFKKNPAIYMAKIIDAYKTARPCPLTTCPVMGDKLDADAYSFVYEGREFKFCCDGCMDDFEKDPAKFVKIWDDAEKAAQDAKK